MNSVWENLNGGSQAPNFQRKSGGSPSWEIGPFRGKLGPFQFRGRLGPIPPHPTATGEEQKLPRKGPFWPNWRLSGQAPRLLSPRLDFSAPCLFFQEKLSKSLPKPRFSKPIFSHSAGPTKLDRPYRKQLRFLGLSGFRARRAARLLTITRTLDTAFLSFPLLS